MSSPATGDVLVAQLPEAELAPPHEETLAATNPSLLTWRQRTEVPARLEIRKLVVEARAESIIVVEAYGSCEATLCEYAVKLSAAA